MKPNNALRTARQQRNWTQQMLAAHLNTTRKTINRWEQGHALPGPYFRALLCELFGMTMQELWMDEQDACEVPFYWYMPFPRNPFFTGRDDLLEQLHVILCQNKAATSTKSVALSGLGGIGKTQTAIEYVYRHAQEYSAVFWITAETSECLLASFSSLVDLLQLPEHIEADQGKRIDTVRRWLTDHPGWLLILDNVEDLELVKQVLPATLQGAILFTTRLQTLETLAVSVKMEQMTVEEGTWLLLRRAGRLTTDRSLDQLPPSEVMLARTIVEALGGLPLAIDQAGAYIEETQCSLEAFLCLYQKVPLPLLSERSIGSEHPNSVVKTFALAFERLQQHQSAAAEFLVACAFLAPDAIPEELIIQGASQLGPLLQALAADPLQYQAALKALLSSSLIRRHTQAKTLSIHRLVQVVLRETMPEEEQQKWTRRLARAIDHVFPSGDRPSLTIEQWTWCEQLVPHALSCAAFSLRWVTAMPEVTSLLMKTGDYFRGCAQYEEAESLFQNALVIREQVLGPSHPETATTFDSLGTLYKRQGKYIEAEPLLRHALAIREQVLGFSHPETASSLDNLGMFYTFQGKYEEAEPLLQRALAIREQVLGPSHIHTANSLNALGVLYAEQRKYEEAELLFQSALAIREQVLGPSHIHTANSRANLGIVYAHQGKYEKAELLLQRMLAINEQVFGPSHPETANSLENLGSLYRDQGWYEEAESLLLRALAIREQVLGPAHPDTAEALHSLGILYQGQGRYEEAESLLQRVLAIREQVLEPSHPDMAQALHDLGVLYQSQGRHEEAESFLQRALAIREQVLGPSHPHTIQTLHDLEVLYRCQGKYEGTELFLLDNTQQRTLGLFLETPLAPQYMENTHALLTNNQPGV